MTYATEFEIHLGADLISGTCVLISILMSAALIGAHLRNFTNPKEQRHIVRILFMVPIYCIDSYLSLVFRGWGKYLDVARDSYESFVIFSFMKLCIAYGGGEGKLVQAISKRKPMQHMWPLNYWTKPFQPDLSFVVWCKRGTLAFVIINPIIAILTLVLESTGHYEEGNFSLTNAYPYIAFIDNMGVSIALYALVLFYMATEDALRLYNPLGKFLCVKSVIFFSFWQSVALAVLVKIQFIADFGSWTAEDIGSGLQEFLICIEMMVASFTHVFVFSYKPYEALPVIAVIEGTLTPKRPASASAPKMSKNVRSADSIQSYDDEEGTRAGPSNFLFSWKRFFALPSSHFLDGVGGRGGDPSSRKPLLSAELDGGGDDPETGGTEMEQRQRPEGKQKNGLSKFDNLWKALDVKDLVHDTRKTFLSSVEEHLSEAGDASQIHEDGLDLEDDLDDPYLNFHR